MSYYTTHLSLDLLVKEFLRWTFGKVTGKMAECVIHPSRLALLSSEMQISPDKLNNLCITDKKTVIKRCYVNRRINVS